MEIDPGETGLRQFISPLTSCNYPRNVRKRIYLDSLPQWFMLVLLIISFVVILGVTCVGMFAVPEGEATNRKLIPFDPDYFTNFKPFEHSVSDLSASNLRLLYSFYFTFNNTYTGIQKNDVRLGVKIEAKMKEDTNWTLIDSKDVYRTLICTQGNRITDIDGSRYMSACNAVRVVSFSHISWNEYKVTVVFQNLQDLYKRDVIAGDIVAQYSYTNDAFVSFEMAIRLTYSIISIFVWLYFTFITLKAQWFSKMHTQQKWLIFILFFHIWFYDPIYYLQIFVPGWVFPFIHILMATTFIFAFLLYLLIFFHSLFKKREDRTFLGFYLTKILIIVSCWISTIITLTWSRLYNRDDPTITGLSQTPGFIYFEGVTIALILIYVIILLYYIIRAIGSFRKFKKKYSTRFKVVGSFAIFVLLSMTIVTMLGDRFRYTGQGFSFLSSHTIIFLYFLYVSFLFLPTGNIEPDRKKEQERRESIEMEQEVESQMEENYTDQEEKQQNLDEVSLDVEPTV